MGNESKFRALAPDDNIELHDYEEALDFVFSQDNVRNIALTGAYGL